MGVDDWFSFTTTGALFLRVVLVFVEQSQQVTHALSGFRSQRTEELNYEVHRNASPWQPATGSHNKARPKL